MGLLTEPISLPAIWVPKLGSILSTLHPNWSLCEDSLS